MTKPIVKVTSDKTTTTYGTEATLNANVNMEGLTVDSISYQWYRNGAIIDGATSARYITPILDVGVYTYTCYVTVTKGGVTTEEVVSNNVSISVTPATPTATISMSNYTYGGEVSQPTCLENISGGTITYYYNTNGGLSGGILWSNITPTKLPVGAYYMYAVIGATTNYSAGYSNVVRFEVTKATMSITFSADGVESGSMPNLTYTSTYDTDGLTVKVTSSVDARIREGSELYGEILELRAGVETTFVTRSEVGTYRFDYEIYADNYESISGIITIVIDKLLRPVQWETEDSYIYSGTDLSDNVKAYIIGADETTKLYCDVIFDREFIDVGTYTVTAMSRDKNYELTNYTKTIRIVKAENSFVVNVAQGLIYNSQPQELLEAIDNNEVADDVFYSIGIPLNEDNFNDEAIASTNKPTATNSGTYTVYFYVPTSDRYLATSGSVDVTIGQYDLANVTIAEIPDQTFTGAEVTPKPTISVVMGGQQIVLLENVDFKYTYSNNINSSQEAVLTITSVANSNYKGMQSTTFTIKGEFVEIPKLLGGAIIYDGTMKKVSMTTSDLYTITGDTGVNAGTYTAIVSLVDKVNYSWNNQGNTKDDITITWEILKADVTLELDKTSVSIRLGETDSVGATITLTDVVGNIDGQALTVSGASGFALMQASSISSSKSTITIVPTNSTTGAQTVTVKYSGDENHNESNEVTFDLEIPAINVNIIVDGNRGGLGTVSGVVDSATNEVAMYSNIAFTATPLTGYGLIKYSIQGVTTYITNDGSRNIDDVFTSEYIQITEELLNGEAVLTIVLYFDEIIVIDVDLDSTNTGSTQITADGIATTYESNDVISKYTYNEVTQKNELQAFKSANVKFDVEATQIDGQYYVVKNIIIGNQDKPVLKLNTTIETEVSDLIENTIAVTAAKIFDSATRTVTQESVDVGTLTINTTNDPDKITISNVGVFIIEGANVNVVINKTNTEYDFLGIKIGNSVTLKSQLTGTWTHTASTSTWSNQALTEDIYNMAPVMLERWYTTETVGRTIEVEVDEGLDARLVHADIGYSYTLANNIFSSGSDALYAGNWKVVIEGANVPNYTVEVELYTESSNTTKGEGETFKIDSTITKVVIRVKAVTP